MLHQLTPDQEQQLVAQARTGADGVRDLYRHFLLPVYAYIAYRVGSVQDAEDLTSETFLRVDRASAKLCLARRALVRGVVVSRCTQHGRRLAAQSAAPRNAA